MDQGRLARLLTSLHSTDPSLSVLHRICVVCADTEWLDGAGVSRIDHGRHETLVASNPTAGVVERFQVDFGQGPCVEVFTTFRQYHEPDLRSERAARRWPEFSPAAVEQGVLAAFAFPLLHDGVATGALDVYSRRTGEMDPGQIEDTVLLADLAALAIGQYDQHTAVAEVGLSAETTEPWAHPAVVHNASGMVAEQLDIDVDEALLRLRAVAFVTGRPLADVSGDVVSRALMLESWSDHE